jgi:hypothetical protein
MGLDMVGMAVAALFVVGHQDVGAQRYKYRRHLVGQCRRIAGGEATHRLPISPRVAEPQQDAVGPENRSRPAQLLTPPRPERRAGGRLPGVIVAPLARSRRHNHGTVALGD